VLRVSARTRRLVGSYNVRDLGGLPTGDGRAVRAGAVFRSDYPAFAEQQEGAVVRELGLRTVVDLRRRSEAEFECVAWAEHGVDHHRSPLVAGEHSSWGERYVAYLRERPETVVEAVRRVLDPTGHPVLFHCAAGKDRTGVVAALVLSVLGVPGVEITADHELSAPSVDAVIARLRAGGGPYVEVLGRAGMGDQTPRAEHMAAFLAWLDGQGGAERWLLEHGLEDDVVGRGRAALVV